MPRKKRPSGKLGVGDGLYAFLAGIGFVLTTPSVWPLAAVPVFMLLLMTCGLFALGGWGAWELSRQIVGESSGTWGEVGAWVLTVLLSLVSLLAGLCLAQPLSGWALEKIALAYERALMGRRRPEPGFFHGLFLGTKVAVITLFVGAVVLGLLLLVGILVPPALAVTIPLKFLVAAWLLAWDFFDYPLGLRGLGLRARLSWVGGHFWPFTVFGLAWATVLLIPGVALLLLPMGVAGAARLLVEAERDTAIECSSSG
jgi:CysZ protein